jgi:hypothetical protein
MVVVLFYITTIIVAKMAEEERPWWSWLLLSGVFTVSAILVLLTVWPKRTR